MIATAFGLVGKGSQTFLSLKAVRSYARRELYAHPTWVAQIVRHHVGGGQVVVEEVRRMALNRVRGCPGCGRFGCSVARRAHARYGRLGAWIARLWWRS